MTLLLTRCILTLKNHSQINFANVEFPAAGVYRYVIQMKHAGDYCKAGVVAMADN